MRLLEPLRPIALAGLVGILGASALMGALYLGNPMDKVFFLICLLGITLPFVKNLERFSFLAIGGTLPIMLTHPLHPNGYQSDTFAQYGWVLRYRHRGSHFDFVGTLGKKNCHEQCPGTAFSENNFTDFFWILDCHRRQHTHH